MSVRRQYTHLAQALLNVMIRADAGWVVDRIVAVANNILIDANQRNADHEICKVNGSDNANAEKDDILAFTLATAPHTLCDK
jgi:hypothetical protein